MSWLNNLAADPLLKLVPTAAQQGVERGRGIARFKWPLYRSGINLFRLDGLGGAIPRGLSSIR